MTGKPDNARAGSEMRIAVTGATGRLGSLILETLRSSGHVVTTISRPGTSGSDVTAGLTAPFSPIDRLVGTDWLIHCAGKLGEGAEVAGNVAMAAWVGRAAEHYGARLINCSSVAVYGAGHRRTIDEAAECRPISDYGRAKLRAEEVIDSFVHDAIHLRIGSVPDADLIDHFMNRPLVTFTKSGELTSWVLPDDVADIVRFIVSRSPAPKRTILNAVRPGLGDRTYGELARRFGVDAVLPITLPATIPHVLRRLRRKPSLPATTSFEPAGLHDLGYRFLPLADVAPIEWDLPRTSGPRSWSDLRILHSTDTLDRERGGGTASRTLDVAAQIARRGAKVSVVSLQREKRRPLRTSANGVTSIAYPDLHDRFHVPNLWFLRGLGEIVADHDVVHLMGHWSLINLIVARHARRRGVPYVICPAGALQRWGRSTALKLAYDHLLGGRRMVNQASAFVAVVGSELDDFRRSGLGARRVTVIPNGADFERPTTRRVPQTCSATGSRRYVLFLGRLHPIKGPDLLLSAFSSVADEIDLDVIFAGPANGSEQELQRLHESSGLVDRVRFAGFVDGQEKEDLLAGCALLAIPSRKEAMSMVVLEAAIHGKPVIATTECGLDELLSDGGGWLVAPTAQAIATALRAANRAELETEGARLRSTVERHFSWDVVADQYLEFYRAVLDT